MNTHQRNRIEGDVGYIGLTKGYVAIIDAEDFDKVSSCVWCAKEDGNRVYARRRRVSNGECRQEYLHRVILNVPDGVLVDHIDGNPLNNRKSNLRPATNTQNQRNQRKRKDNSSGYKGVYWLKSKALWRSQITLGGKRKHLGYFSTPHEAHEAYVRAATNEYGRYACAG